jgi:hypothetical protein
LGEIIPHFEETIESRFSPTEFMKEIEKKKRDVEKMGRKLSKFEKV